MRLDRYLAEYADLSRKEARRAIHNGWVEVDGQPVHDHGLEIVTGAQVWLDGQPIAPRLPRYWMLHKPLGYVSGQPEPDKIPAVRLLTEVNRQGQTILMVTHSTKAASHAKRILFIKDGQIFHQIYRGDMSRASLFQQIADAQAALMTGGDAQ